MNNANTQMPNKTNYEKIVEDDLDKYIYDLLDDFGEGFELYDPKGFIKSLKKVYRQKIRDWALAVVGDDVPFGSGSSDAINAKLSQIRSCINDELGSK